jgi:acetyl/propionyl-CoA carboxylase alpha subunit
MSDRLRISGKTFILPAALSKQGWKFSIRPGGWIVAAGPKGERRRFMISESGGKLAFSIDGILYLADVQSGETSSASTGGSDADLTAQFPGKVRKLLVEAGTTVKAGEPLLLVEAMKMEFSVKAPSDGKITRWNVKEGQQLSPGDRFLEFEAKAAGKKP